MNFNGDGVPIAQEKYKSNALQKKNKVLYFDAKNEKEDLREEDITDEQLFSIFGKHNMRSLKAREKSRASLVKLSNTKQSKRFNEVQITKQSQFSPIPYSLGGNDDSEARDVYFLNGKSGAGKSYFAGMLIKVYRAFGLKAYIITDIKDPILFGNKSDYLDINDFVDKSEGFEDDKKSYEQAKIKFKYAKKQFKNDPQTLMKMELAINHLKPSQDQKNKMKLKLSDDQIKKVFNNCVVLFDDYENNEDIAKIEYLRDHLLTKGRHWKCNLIINNHKGNDGQNFKMIKIETSNYVMFSKGSSHERNYLLYKYIGMDAINIKRISLALRKSRWASINVNMGYVLTENEAYSLI